MSSSWSGFFQTKHKKFFYDYTPWGKVYDDMLKLFESEYRKRAELKRVLKKIENAVLRGRRVTLIFTYNKDDTCDIDVLVGRRHVYKFSEKHPDEVKEGIRVYALFHDLFGLVYMMVRENAMKTFNLTEKDVIYPENDGNLVLHGGKILKFLTTKNEWTFPAKRKIVFFKPKIEEMEW